MVQSKLFIDTPHLPFQPHDTQIDVHIAFTKEDLKILSCLGEEYAEIAHLPVQSERIEMWKRLNDLQTVKPMVWMNEVCWNEMEFNSELTLHTSSTFCQRIELEFRRTIYQWRHMQADMVVEPVLYSPLIVSNTGFGITPIADMRETAKDREIASRHFYNQLINEDDIKKIQVPKIRHNTKRTEEFFQAYKMIFDGILNVKKRGSPGFWFAPWDDLVFWMGADNVLLNLSMNPQFMHKIIQKVLEVYLQALSQFESEHILASNNCNVRIGSGAYGYTNQLPNSDANHGPLKSRDIWGACAAQLLGSVSPLMHEEFGIHYELNWLEKFGLAYYGCCEPLHDRIELLEKIPNLRKISMSPWANLREAVRKMENRYVVSLKPNPAVLAYDIWEPDVARNELKERLNEAGGCNVEVIMKDISTVRYEPQRLWEWANIAEEVTHCYA